MGSDQSALPAGAPGSNLRSQRDEEIPYTQYSISKPIDSHSPRQSPRPQKTPKPVIKPEKDGTPKHEIVVVADGHIPVKDPDPELTKLNTIPVFFPIMRGSLNIPSGSKETDVLDKLDHKQVLLLCLRYQDHLRQLAEAVAFDQNALCIRIKEMDHTIHVLLNALTERQKKYSGVSARDVQIQPSVVNCTNYNASAPCVSSSISPYCLQNGTTINGFCATEVAVCVDNESLDTTFEACTTENSGNTNSSSISLHKTPFYVTTTTVAMVIAANVAFP